MVDIVVLQETVRGFDQQQLQDTFHDDLLEDASLIPESHLARRRGCLLARCL